MCGIVCIISKNKSGFFGKDVSIFREMLIADQIRGSDGTGIFYNNGNKIKTLKAPVVSSEFVQDKSYDLAERDIFQSARFVVGHNRAATIGNHTHQNTHPFRCGNITLIHNGTLNGHKNLADTESDSMAICHSIAKIGFKETVKKINGAFTLVWYDEKQKTLNFTRNWQRPLYIVETKELFCFVSEPKLAEWILDRNNQKVTKVTCTDVLTLYQFEEDNWSKYETEKYTVSTPNVPTHTSFPNTIPSSSIIGKEIVFIPTKIDIYQKSKLVGEYEDRVSGEIIECRFWTTEKEAASLLEQGKSTYLRGYVSQTGWTKGGEFFIMRNVYVPKITQITDKKEGTVTFNQKKLTPPQATAVSKSSCLYCGGIVGKLLHACEVMEEDGHLSALCPDCTDWSYRTAQKVN